MSENLQTSPKLTRKQLKAKKKEESYYLASQWQLMAHKLAKHKLARFSMMILGILYFIALFGNFFAPSDLTSYDGSSKDMPPTAIHWITEDGRFVGPFVYGATMERDPKTYKKVFAEDKEKIYPIRFFTHGKSYQWLGLIESDLHLFGVDEGGKIFLFGTDSMGRDLFSRIILGSQVSLTIPFAGTFLSFILGLVLGSISGYFGGWIDNLIQRIIEVLNSLPSLPLWMALSAAIPAGIPPVQMYLLITVILSFIGWTGLARVVRGKFMSLKNEDYVMAARLAGVSDIKIIFKHLVPGFMSYLIVNLTLGIPSMIIGETSMSFLGLGIQAPATSWGVLLKDAQQIQNIANYPWRLLPLIFVVIAVLAFNFLGDGLRDAADPYK
ncbi:MAG: ABC transporter permease [Eubacteriales bacterium]|nr:ABC transporter permease [Eubacteriales bacterium]